MLTFIRCQYGKKCKFDGQPMLYFAIEPVDSPLLAQATFVALVITVPLH